MKQIVLKLYRDLLRYGVNLKYTDKQYFRHRIRKSFKENKQLTDKEEIDFHLQKGRELLIKQRVL
ncbi:mitochondrial ribosome and complex I assembly factor AltMIEF1 [Megalopta genalis]|uniref:mitochondrial ribosome and complex I assembly factor AltMIEF1 n=1 Tax=Megalopta genalis TaxID=115081 RepID=UPI0014435C38|nr:MIEF1 upstream open reading frame protein [Megalopta genalis]XP_033343021.1 MIEF1 upstream open reading frame protein [Megalopta genalis]XP_033343022.1 MIEF1 upstream open reading frame protein [Megalopta genalis]